MIRLKRCHTVMRWVGLSLFVAFWSHSSDWRTYKGDPARSSVSSVELSFPLAQRWVYRTACAPRPAWPEPGKELNRQDFDYCFQPVVAADRVYFGSSADDSVRCLDLVTGRLVWRFPTGGPVRFAPSFWSGNLYVTSDDGMLYCLDATSGTVKWRFEASPESSDHILGQGRLISRYPCRSGAVVLDGTVYLCAGMWPTEGVYIYALEASTGKVIWCNDSSGNIYIDLPHAVASGFSGVAPQGYLCVSGDILLVPTGRSIPAAFDRHTGRLLYYKPEKTHYHGAAYGGGVWCTAAGDLYFHPNNRFHNPSQAASREADPSPQDGMIVYDFATGDQQCHIPGKHRVLVSGDRIFSVGQDTVDMFSIETVKSRSRVYVGDAQWSTPLPGRVYCLALAGGTLITGNRGSITAFEAATGARKWRHDCPGMQIRGLAVVDHIVLAANQAGEILQFSESGSSTAVPCNEILEARKPATVSEDVRKTATLLLRTSGKFSGHGLVAGGTDGRLAQALVAESDLCVATVLPFPDEVEAMRRRLLEEGALGYGVAVLSPSEGGDMGLPPYYADLVVIESGIPAELARQCYHSLHPCGGVLYLGLLGLEQRQSIVVEAGIPDDEVQASGEVVVRGKLAGAGEWRYPWADGGRTGVGEESRVKFPLEVSWFGGPGPGLLVDRHLMGSPPVSTNGRVFLQGQNHVIAYDAYNGRELWTKEIQEVGRKYAQYYSSSLVADDDNVYVVQGDRCLRLNQATGKIEQSYSPPPELVRDVHAEAPSYIDVEWPTTWCVFGPFLSGKRPFKDGFPSGLPGEVVFEEKRLAPVDLETVENVLDFTFLYGGYGTLPLAEEPVPTKVPRRGRSYSYHDVGRMCYAFAEIECPRDGKLLIGAGADWGMRWYLDGKLVFDALRGGATGQRQGFFDRQVCSAADNVFDIDVVAGKHVVAVMVTAGSRGWALASDSVAENVDKLMPVSTGENPNVPNLRDLSWGYLSVADNLLLGSYNVPITAGQRAESHLLWRSENKAVFALEKTTGQVRWVYRPAEKRIVSNIEIAHGDGRLFLIDGTSKADLVKARRRQQNLPAELTLVALDLQTGAELWRQEDVPLLGDRQSLSRLKTNVTHLFMGQPSWGHLIYGKGTVVLGANAAYDASTGEKLWSKTIRPGKLPIIYANELITSSQAFDLRTGESRQAVDVLTSRRENWRYDFAYGCGPVAGCQNMLFFRSGADGFWDMVADGVTNFGGVRSGCARTLLAASGMLLHTIGASGCCCSYNFKTNLGLVSANGDRDVWYVFSSQSKRGRIQHLRLNLGAPGDRRDQGGNPWLAFPRPIVKTAAPAPVTLLMPGASALHTPSKKALFPGTDKSWLYTSGICGVGRLVIGLDFSPEISLPVGGSAPEIDGELEDAEWGTANIIPFQNTPFSMLGAGIELRAFATKDTLYFAYRYRDGTVGRTVSRKRETGRDRFELFIADRKKRIGLTVTVSPAQDSSASFGTVGVSRKVDPAWKGEWQAAARMTHDGWVAEVSIPLATLVASGMVLKQLQFNCMSLNLTESGLEGVFVTDPLYGTKFRSCSGFSPLVMAEKKPAEERLYTVRLHFSELIPEVVSGERVFSVNLQGRRCLENIDIRAETAGGMSCLTKEFRGVASGERITIDLAPGSETGVGRSPVLSGVEAICEE